LAVWWTREVTGAGLTATVDGDENERVPVVNVVFPCPPRLRLQPEFAGAAVSLPDPEVQAGVEAFVLDQYAGGRSLREIAELTDRSHSAVRNILDKHGVRRRAPGAAGQSPPPNH